MRLPLVAAVLLLAPAAQARPRAIGVHAILGFGGEVDVDKVKFEGGGSADGGDDDLEKQYGIAATFEIPLQERIHLGARGALMTSEGDDDEGEFLTVDAGGWARYLFETGGPVVPFAAGGLGLTYGTAENDDQDSDVSGVGWHILLGGGVTYEMGGVDLLGGLFFERQAFPELEGEAGNADVTAEDVVFTRFFLVAGAMF